MPKSAYRDEAKPIAAAAAKRRRGLVSIGELLVEVLIKLGVGLDDEGIENEAKENDGVASENEVELTTSEARSSD